MTAPLRVLLATPDYPPSTGGIQSLLHGLVEHRRAVTYDVVTFATGAAAPADGGGRVELVHPVPGPRPLSIARLNGRVLRRIRSGGYDAVVSGHVVVGPGVAAGGVPWIQYAHAKELAHRPRLTRAVLSRADRVIAVSRHTREMVLAAGARPAAVEVIPPGIRPVGPQAAAARRDDGRTVVAIARLQDEHKGTDVLIRAVALARRTVPDARLVVVGDGPLRPALEALAQREGVADAVVFRGRLSDAERDAELDGCAVFAMLSRVPPGGGGEGFGIVFAEAAARGVAVLAGDAGGARDAVDRDRTGLLVDPLSVEDAAAALVRLLEDPGLRGRLGEAGRAWAGRFAWESVAGRLESALADVARDAARGRRP